MLAANAKGRLGVFDVENPLKQFSMFSALLLQMVENKIWVADWRAQHFDRFAVGDDVSPSHDGICGFCPDADRCVHDVGAPRPKLPERRQLCRVSETLQDVGALVTCGQGVLEGSSGFLKCLRDLFGNLPCHHSSADVTHNDSPHAPVKLPTAAI